MDTNMVAARSGALRRSRIHSVNSSQLGLLCKHIQSPASAGFICVPMIAHGEVLGVLHLIDRTGENISEVEQQLAATVTEYIAMAMLNIRSDKSHMAR